MIDKQAFDRQNEGIVKQTTFSEKIANLFKSRTGSMVKASSVENVPRKSEPMLVHPNKKILLTSASVEDTESPRDNAKPNIMISSLRRDFNNKPDDGNKINEILEITS